MSITVDEWLHELKALEVAQPEGFTKRDVVRATGWSERRVWELLRRWADAGKIRFVGRKDAEDITGRRVTIPVYIVVKEAANGVP